MSSVDVWIADLLDDDWPVDELEALLAEDELIRAGRFHRASDRRDFVVGRGLLRRLLARYTGSENVALTTNRWQKPRVRSNGAAGVEFNLSHAGGVIVLAFGQVGALGVDVEPIRDDLAHLELADRFFAPAERAALATLPADEVPVGFFNCWTRKEAIVKAHGMGLSLPLDSFEVSLRPGAPAELHRVGEHLGNAAAWTLRAFAPLPGYRAALATAGPVGELNERWLEPAALPII